MKQASTIIAAFVFNAAMQDNLALPRKPTPAPHHRSLPPILDLIQEVVVRQSDSRPRWGRRPGSIRPHQG